MNANSRCILAILLTIALCGVISPAGSAVSAKGAEPASDQAAFFESKIRPILADNCWKCHGSGKQFAGLRLDTLQGLQTGGDSGSVINREQPEQSLLLRVVRHEIPGMEMPKEGSLTDSQINDLAQWVKAGAAFPANVAEGKKWRDPSHWAFQPLKIVVPPEVKDAAWVTNEIDRFILAKLEEQGISPAPRADKRVLIRRLTFDLTGLPPTPAAVSAFLNDTSPHAYARLVDRLLASHAYGQRWGRHWLDVARYADSNGLDENIAHGNAWRYRDYVIEAINRDKPFDRFVLEQLAGDLLPADTEADRHEHLIATGFLSIGPKVLAEVNEAKMRMDIIDEQIDSVGRALLGLTVGCARCHDHKFDPIDTRDYYALAGIFKSTKTMDTYTKVAKWHEHLLPSAEADAMQTAFNAQLAAKKGEIDKFVADADAAARASMPNGGQAPEKLETLYPEETKTALARLREELATLEKNPPELPATMGVTEDQVIDVPLHLRGSPVNLGETVPRGVPPVIAGPKLPQFSPTASGRLQFAEWLVDRQNPLTPRVFVNRVWRWHFGRGLVATPDNFGMQGDKPTHAELLDWLADNFMQEGWSLKQLHRQIVLSSTYQQSAAISRENLPQDDTVRTVRYFSRGVVRRLEAEEIRDALLAVSGRLDNTLGGPVLKVKNRGYLFDHTSIDQTDYSSRRRTIYLPVIRNHVYDVLQLFDFADPALPVGDRPSTTVPPQALMMMNSPFVMDCASSLAEKTLASAAEDRARITSLYEVAYQRAPEDREIVENLAFLSNLKEPDGSRDADPSVREHSAWAILCQTILAANEFIYIQ